MCGEDLLRLNQLFLYICIIRMYVVHSSNLQFVAHVFFLLALKKCDDFHTFFALLIRIHL